MSAVAVALLLLVHSFGHDVIVALPPRCGPGREASRACSTAAIAVVVVWVALVAPDRLDKLTPSSFVRIPLEALVLLGLSLVLPARPRRVLAAVAGATFGLLAVIKILDMAFNAQLDRPFNLVSDWGNLVLGIGVVRDSVGTRLTDEFIVLAVLGLIALTALVTASTVRLSAVTARHRRGSARSLLSVGLVWVISAAMSLQLAPGSSLASLSTAQLAVAQVGDAAAAIRDQQRFEVALRTADPAAKIPASDLLDGLRGKDVLLVFVESYGQVAVQGTSYSPGDRHGAASRHDHPERRGFSARTAYLTSSTFGGMSWIAHSTLQSGFVDRQSGALRPAHGEQATDHQLGIRQGGVAHGQRQPGRQTSLVAGQGVLSLREALRSQQRRLPRTEFSWAAMPDQYTLAKFQHNELGPGHPPVMAEMDLVSSHTPWTPLPRMVAVGPARERLGLRLRCRPKECSRDGLAEFGDCPQALWAIDPILDGRTHVVDRPRARQEPRSDAAR